MSKEEYAVEVENISKIYTLRNKNNQYKTDKKAQEKYLDFLRNLMKDLCLKRCIFQSEKR